VAAVLVGLWLAQVVVRGDQLRPDRYSMGVAGLAVCASMWWRRDHALLVGLAVEAIMETTATIGNLFFGPITIAWWSALYALAAWTPDRQFVIGMVGFVVIDFTPDLLSGEFESQNDGFTIVAVIVMLLVRVIVGSRDRQLRLADRERDVAAREAVVRERERIARELHDVIAHHVSTIVVQAGAERRLLTEGQAGTRDVLGTIEDVGRGALTEMRRMVSMLRQGPEEDLAPQPTLSDVPELVRQIQAAGLPVTLQMTGERPAMPAAIELSAYRIVQEALTNALKHARGARASVEINFGAEQVEITVRDDGRGQDTAVVSGGHGLVGMRERVAMYGGTLEARPQTPVGFAVRVRLPVR